MFKDQDLIRYIHVSRTHYCDLKAPQLKIYHFRCLMSLQFNKSHNFGPFNFFNMHVLFFLLEYRLRNVYIPVTHIAKARRYFQSFISISMYRNIFNIFIYLINLFTLVL